MQCPRGQLSRSIHNSFYGRCVELPLVVRECPLPVAWLYARGIRERRRVNQVANLADVGWHDNNVIGGRGPAEYVPRLRQRLAIDDDRWGRMVCGARPSTGVGVDGV